MIDEPVITVKDIYVEVRKLQDTVGAMTPQVQIIRDHEQRLRGLERWKYALPGSLVLALVSVILTVAELASLHR